MLLGQPFIQSRNIAEKYCVRYGQPHLTYLKTEYYHIWDFRLRLNFGISKINVKVLSSARSGELFIYKYLYNNKITSSYYCYNVVSQPTYLNTNIHLYT